MKTISLTAIQEDPQILQEVKKVLEEGRLIRFPAPSGYKLAADLSAPSAVISMIQAKRKVKNGPALVFVPDESWVPKIAANVSAQALALMSAFWPGPITLLFEASDELPAKVRKQLTKATGWLGVRIPCDRVTHSVVQAFGKPLLVSSANLAKKHGAGSPAQIRKNFGRTVELFIDAGDLVAGQKSTLVDVTQGYPMVVRNGAISEEAIQQALAS